jgi:hypothetical protein
MLPKDILSSDKRCRAFLLIVRVQYIYPRFLRKIFSLQGSYDFISQLKKADILEECHIPWENNPQFESIKVSLSRLNPILKSQMIRKIRWLKVKPNTEFYALCCKWAKNWFGVSDEQFMTMKEKDILNLGGRSN